MGCDKVDACQLVTRSTGRACAAWGAIKTPSQGEEVSDTCICKKTSPFGTRLFIKSGDDLLSHNVADKRVKHQACLSVLQRARATSWNRLLQEQ